MSKNGKKIMTEQEAVAGLTSAVNFATEVRHLIQRAETAERERDALRDAMKEIIGLEDRTFGATLANDKLRQAQAIAQNALAASGGENPRWTPETCRNHKTSPVPGCKTCFPRRAETAHNLQSVVD